MNCLLLKIRKDLLTSKSPIYSYLFEDYVYSTSVSDFILPDWPVMVSLPIWKILGNLFTLFWQLNQPGINLFMLSFDWNTLARSLSYLNSHKLINVLNKSQGCLNKNTKKNCLVLHLHLHLHSLTLLFAARRRVSNFKQEEEIRATTDTLSVTSESHTVFQGNPLQPMTSAYCI